MRDETCHEVKKRCFEFTFHIYIYILVLHDWDVKQPGPWNPVWRLSKDPHVVYILKYKQNKYQYINNS